MEHQSLRHQVMRTGRTEMTNPSQATRIRTALAGLVLALLATAMLFALPDGVASANTNQQKCASDGAVPDAANNPGLVADCAALLDSKKTLEGPRDNSGKLINSGEDCHSNAWNSKVWRLNWSSSLPMSQWEGVRVRNNRVTHVDLEGSTNYQLKGKIHKRLAELSELRELHLPFNQLRGRIPRELGKLSKLEWLKLICNDLRDKIPPQLGDLSQLEYLILSGNEFRGRIPKRLSNLSNLKALDLAGNNLSGRIPKWWAKLSNLESILLRKNQFTGKIPSELGDAPKLKWLELYYNNLTGCLPESLRNIEDLGFTSMYKDNPNRLSYHELRDKHKKDEIPYPFRDLRWCG